MASTVTSGGEVVSPRTIQEAAQRHIERWLSFCDDVLDWNRDHMLRGNPDPAIIEEHRRTLKWIIRFTRMMHAEVSDLDFPSRQFAERLAIRLHQLEDAWGTFHDHSLSPAEADRILADVFPYER